jgi:hypothetical protein
MRSASGCSLIRRMTAAARLCCVSSQTCIALRPGIKWVEAESLGAEREQLQPG